MPKIGSCQHWFGVFVSVGHKGVTGCNSPAGHRREGWAPSFSPRLRLLGSWHGPYWASGPSLWLGQCRHPRGFILWDGGSPSQVETHSNVPRITKGFDDSGSLIILEQVF